MESRSGREVSFLVFGGFIILFILFLFLSSEGSTEGALTLDSVVGSPDLGGTSLITLIIVFVILVVILVAVVLLLKKFKKKKHKFIAPKPKDNSSEGSKRSFKPLEENVKPKANKKSVDLADEDIESLFSEDVGIETDETSKLEDFPILNKKRKVSKQNSMVNVNQLKNEINLLFDKGSSSKQIFNILNKKGFTSQQISKAIDSVNDDNLKKYIDFALKQNFSKDQIVRNLVANGWKLEQIKRFLKS